MKIMKLISQYRRDFTALMECEFCGHQVMNNSGYDDRYYHDNVIPNMKCGKCGESTISKGGEIEKTTTRYPEIPNLIVLDAMRDEYSEIKEIVYRTRQTGNTTWILKAAIKQPNCVIVAKNMQQAKHLEKNYYYMLSKCAWYQKLYWKWFGRKHPKFMSISSRFEGLRLPIIFDNGSLC